MIVHRSEMKNKLFSILSKLSLFKELTKLEEYLNPSIKKIILEKLASLKKVISKLEINKPQGLFLSLEQMVKARL